MSNSNPLNSNLLLNRLREVLRFEPNNVPAFCQIGREFARLGREQDARKCYDAAVNALRRAIREGNVEAALMSEKKIYETFVKLEESEQNYYRCFSDWREDLVQLGTRFRQNQEVSQYDTHRVAFFLHAGYVLGHTEVLFKLLEGLKTLPGTPFHPRLYVLTDFGDAFLERVRNLGVETVLIQDILPAGRAAPLLERFLWLREHFRKERFGVCIWVSAPIWSAFALPMRLAPVQIYWALRFHPISGSYIDGYITYGPKEERERVFGKQSWRVCPVPLTIEATPPEREAVARLRAQFPQSFLMGTLARAEKMDSQPFLDAVVQILKANPHTGFLWTGRSRHPVIDGFFRAAGVAERCHFVGWVDTALHAAALDLFLETFPFGCGITGYQALGAGTPLLSYLAENTVFGMQFHHEFAAPRAGTAAPDLERYPVLCARTPDEYVTLASHVIGDADFREAVAARGKAFFDAEINNVAAYSQRFFDTIAEIARNKAGSAAGANSLEART